MLSRYVVSATLSEHRKAHASLSYQSVRSFVYSWGITVLVCVLFTKSLTSKRWMRRFWLFVFCFGFLIRFNENQRTRSVNPWIFLSIPGLGCWACKAVKRSRVMHHGSKMLNDLLSCARSWPFTKRSCAKCRGSSHFRDFVCFSIFSSRSQNSFCIISLTPKLTSDDCI